MLGSQQWRTSYVRPLRSHACLVAIMWIRGAASSSSFVSLEHNAIDGVVRRRAQVIPETSRSQHRLVEQRNQPVSNDKHGSEHPDPTHNQAPGPNTLVDKHPLDGNTARINARPQTTWLTETSVPNTHMRETKRGPKPNRSNNTRLQRPPIRTDRPERPQSHAHMEQRNPGANHM